MPEAPEQAPAAAPAVPEPPAAQAPIAPPLPAPGGGNVDLRA